MEPENTSPAREELGEVLRSRWYLTRTEIDAILADPEFFKPHLREAIAKRARLGGVPEEPVDATDSNGVFFLTHWNDTTIIPDLLRCLRLNEMEQELIYGDSVPQNM